MAFLAPLAFGTAATAGGAAATAGLFGSAGAFSLGTTLATVGTGLSVAGALRSGQANSQAADYNAAMAQREASSKEVRIRQEGERSIGRLRASISKSGATFEGTPLMALAESAANNEIDALNVRQGGEMESSLYRMRGQSARRTGYVQAGTSLLSGMSRIG
jgi:hypothetical protein